MKETRFIEQNKEKWAEYETLLGQSAPDPEKIYQLFYSISDDLAFARTHYPNRSVRLYLNNLVRNLFRNVYAGRRLSWASVIDFWKTDLPVALYQTRFEQYFALVVFFVAALIGAVSCLSDHEFANGILGESYVRMTINNIKNGKPMAVYDESDPFTMFLYIAGNNLKVCLFGFVSGIFAGTITLVFLLRNAIMVGTFQFFFYKYNLLWDSFLTIWMHGAIEISCLVIGSGAGFSLAKGLLFPGTYTRIQSLLLASRRAMTIMMGLIPLILVAAFIESYLTRYYNLPWAIRFTFIFTCLAFMAFYFWWYPVRVGRRLKEQIAQADGLKFVPGQPFSANRIYSPGEIFGFALRSFAVVLSETWWLVIGLSVLYVYGNRWMIDQNLTFFQGSESSIFHQVFQYIRQAPAAVLNVFCWVLLGWKSFRPLYQHTNGLGSTSGQSLFIGLLPFGVISMVMAGLLFLPSYWAFIYSFLFPLLFVWLGYALRSPGRWVSLVNVWDTTLRNLSKVATTLAINLVLGFLAISLTSSELFSKVLELIYINIQDSDDGFYLFLYRVFPALIGYGATLLIFQLTACASLILSYTLEETQEATGLLNRIKTTFPE